MANKHDYGERSLQMHYEKHGKLKLFLPFRLKQVRTFPLHIHLVLLHLVLLFRKILNFPSV